MRALAIVHQRDAGPGVFGDVIRDLGVQLDFWMVAEGGAPPRPRRDYRAVLSFGGAVNADQEKAHPWLLDEMEELAAVLARGTPVLGICLGAQLLARAAGATARPALEPEIGWYEVEVTDRGAEDPLVGPLWPRFTALQWHGYEFLPAPGAVELARSARCLQAYRLREAAWGIQFHAEAVGANVESWIDRYRSDPDAVRLGLDPEALRARTGEALAGWKEVGRGLCTRFMGRAGTK